jgi:hypothetical protein
MWAANLFAYPIIITRYAEREKAEERQQRKFGGRISAKYTSPASRA